MGFEVATTTEFEVPREQSALALLTPAVVGEQISEFEYYRKTIGFSQYLEIAPTLGPHLLLLAALLAATVASLRARAARVDGLWLAWAVLAVGLAIGAFHASAFAYFWMTLGLFPAVAFATAAGSMRDALPAGRERIAVLAAAGLWLVLGTQGVARMAELSIDSQSTQRESLAFVHRNFDATDAGFHPEHGPFCRREAEPIRVYFSQVIFRHFAGETREIHTRRLLEDLRRRPVKFVVQSFRLNQFPVEVRRFLADNYQPYRASVFVAGRHLAGSEGERSEFELIVPGRYRWLPGDRPAAGSDRPRTLEPGEVACGVVAPVVHAVTGLQPSCFQVETASELLDRPRCRDGNELIGASSNSLRWPGSSRFEVRVTASTWPAVTAPSARASASFGVTASVSERSVDFEA